MQGGLVVMAVGMGLAALKRGLDFVIEAFKRTFFVRVQVDSRDDAYRWLMHWLTSQPSAAKSRNLSATTSLLAFGSSVPGDVDAETGVRVCATTRMMQVCVCLREFGVTTCSCSFMRWLMAQPRVAQSRSLSASTTLLALRA